MLRLLCHLMIKTTTSGIIAFKLNTRHGVSLIHGEDFLAVLSPQPKQLEIFIALLLKVSKLFFNLLV